MSKTTFERHEKKYMLTREQCTALMKRLKGRLKADKYGSYTISNIYYDTDNFDLIRMSIEKPVYKEKGWIVLYRHANIRNLSRAKGFAR